MSDARRVLDDMLIKEEAKGEMGDVGESPSKR